MYTTCDYLVYIGKYYRIAVTQPEKNMLMNMNLKTIISSELAALGLGSFAHLAPEIEKEIAADAEAAVRKLVARGCDRVLRNARQKTKKPATEKEITLELL